MTARALRAALAAAALGVACAAPREPAPAPPLTVEDGWTVPKPPLGARQADIADALRLVDARMRHPAAHRQPAELVFGWFALGANGTPPRAGGCLEAWKGVAHATREVVVVAADAPTAPFGLGAALLREEHLQCLLALAAFAPSATFGRQLFDAEWPRVAARFGAGGAPPTVREAAWWAAVARELERAGGRAHGLGDRLDAALACAEAGVVAAPPGDPFAAAVGHAVARLRGAASTPGDDLARLWPGDLWASPFHAWFAAHASRELPAAARAALASRLQALLAARNADGCWPAQPWGDGFVATALFAGVVGLARAPDGVPQ